MKRYYSKMSGYVKYRFIEDGYRSGKIPRREQHKILVWYEKEEKTLRRKKKRRIKRYNQSCFDRNELLF